MVYLSTCLCLLQFLSSVSYSFQCTCLSSPGLNWLLGIFSLYYNCEWGYFLFFFSPDSSLLVCRNATVFVYWFSNDPDNRNCVVTHLEPDILQCDIKWTLGSITMNKAGGGDGILAELFKILKDNAVKVLHSICQQIWKTQQWPQDWKRSVLIPVSKKSNAKECWNYHTVVLISHASKVMLKILPAMLQQYVNRELQM